MNNALDVTVVDGVEGQDRFISIGLRIAFRLI